VPTATLQQAFDQARAELKDTQVSGGEVATNTALTPHLNQAWRRVWRAMGNGGSQRVEKFVYVNLAAQQQVLIPSTVGIMDFGEPELIEERLASTTVAIASTDTATPINVTFTGPHGLGPNGSTGSQLIISEVIGTYAPWGTWSFSVTSPTVIQLIGSASDGAAGTGGIATVSSQFRFTEVLPANQAGQCIDGIAGQVLGCYLWMNEQLLFHGCVNTQQLRITYWSSGTPPVLTNQQMGIDDCLDLVACITAANFAAAQGWSERAQQLNQKAFGPGEGPEELGGLMYEFLNSQIKLQQRGPQIRRGAFRYKRLRWADSAIIGS
jgi:hypothetical protein